MGPGELANEPLDILGVIDQLEVGPVRVEPRRIMAPYSVTRDSQVHTMNLIYRFEEDVFVPGEPASLSTTTSAVFVSRSRTVQTSAPAFQR